MLIEVLPTILFSAVLLLGISLLMLGHARAWRASQAEALDDREYQFRRRRFRRHMQTTGLAGVVAIALPIGLVVMQLWPRVGAFFWGGVLLVVVWICLLAMADVLATGHYFSQLRNKCVQEQVKLHVALHRAQELRREGPDPESGDTTPEDGET